MAVPTNVAATSADPIKPSKSPDGVLSPSCWSVPLPVWNSTKMLEMNPIMASRPHHTCKVRTLFNFVTDTPARQLQSTLFNFRGGKLGCNMFAMEYARGSAGRTSLKGLNPKSPSFVGRPMLSENWAIPDFGAAARATSAGRRAQGLGTWLTETGLQVLKADVFFIICILLSNVCAECKTQLVL
jgi:hypothetical protein